MASRLLRARFPRVGATALAIAAASAWVNLSLASPTEAERNVARDAMEAGDEAFEASRFTEALEHHRKADVIMGVPTTGLAVASSLAALGRLVEARKVALHVAKMKLDGNAPPAFVLARERAANLVLELDATIPTVQVVPAIDEEGAIASISVDNALLPRDQSEWPYSLDPGRHRIALDAPGYKPVRVELEIGRGGLVHRFVHGSSSVQ